jgi:arsenate reductase
VKGLALLRENHIEPQLITYMTDGLTEAQIAEIARKAGSVRAIMREKTALEKGVELNQNDDALIAAIANDLNLLQRPILIKAGEAIVGRPIEAMLAFK